MLCLSCESCKVTTGVLYSNNNCHIYVKGNSTVWFMDNTAMCGGAINLFVGSHMYFEGHSITVFNNNTAKNSGGAI